MEQIRLIFLFKKHLNSIPCEFRWYRVEMNNILPYCCAFHQDEVWGLHFRHWWSSLSSDFTMWLLQRNNSHVTCTFIEFLGNQISSTSEWKCPFYEERKKERKGYYLKFVINGEFVKVIKIYFIFLSKFDRWFFFRLCSPHHNYEGFFSYSQESLG